MTYWRRCLAGPGGECLLVDIPGCQPWEPRSGTYLGWPVAPGAESAVPYPRWPYPWAGNPYSGCIPPPSLTLLWADDGRAAIWVYVYRARRRELEDAGLTPAPAILSKATATGAEGPALLREIRRLECELGPHGIRLA